ncbi:hypothetical protein KSF_075910 [Reticulibacter mediterranei]|uniref:Uncharacterized protein n=1 Tax=Reticulibacter mediterranei TaxID=2778369 RepID=A0A8J3IS02_9CHLR|nr:hypothetical protein [Reticulibacter mediterranei]GHO97543.1 hypothetical protein KSF_075910 [Reticulibacter mediterranei]
MLPHTSRHVNAALLHAFGWQLRLQSIPEGWQGKLQTRLLSWLEQENQPETCVALIETLGHWRGEKPVGIADALLKRVEGEGRSQEIPSLLMALARLAS